MAEKRFYWLKFRSDFFDSKRIKKLRNMAGGDTYCIIYLKMQLKALKTDGVLEFTGIEDQFADELALDIDERPDDVRVTLMFLLQYGMCECSDNIHYFLPYVVENTGKETSSAQRVRNYRKKQKELQSNADVTDVKRICNTEIDIHVDEHKNTDKNTDTEVEIKKNGGGERFEEFWELYPRKANKVRARAAFNALNVTDDLFATMMDGLERWKTSRQWQDTNFIPYPATWLHGKQWEDEDIPQSKSSDGMDNLRSLYAQFEGQ